VSIVILDLAVGPDLTLADAAVITEAASRIGVTAIRVRDGAPGQTLDASVVASYLAGTETAEQPRLGWIVEASTSHNAPTNLARRLNSLDRATGGRAGLALRAGDGDEVSDPVAPKPGADQAARWAEYAQVLKKLWLSFPAAALVGDQRRGVFAENTLIKPIDFAGDFYRVAGPLDGPTSPQGGPVLIADDIGTLGWDVAARSADAVIVGRAVAAAADADLSDALARAGRAREQVALIARVDGRQAEAVLAALPAFVVRHRLDGVELVAAGTKDDVLALIAAVVPSLAPTTGATLRGAFAPVALEPA